MSVPGVHLLTNFKIENLIIYIQIVSFTINDGSVKHFFPPHTQDEDPDFGLHFGCCT